MNQKGDINESIQCAEKALDYMRDKNIDPYPDNYELWYTHLDGKNQPLSQAVKDAIERFGEVPEKIVSDIRTNYLPLNPQTEQVGIISSKFLNEFEHVINLIHESQESTTSYENDLEIAINKLVGTQYSEGLRTIVDKLISDTKKMKEHSHSLEGKLHESMNHIDSLNETLKEVRKETIIDPLTGIANRKHFDSTLKHAIDEARQTNKPLSLLLGDVDHFKKFNDTYGHQIGDQVLRLVASVLRKNSRDTDLAARYGGEEFSVILPSTPIEEALNIAETIRRNLANKKMLKKSTSEELGTVTMSLGAALFNPTESSESLINRADSYLYQAKKEGRNRVYTRDIS